MIGCNLRAGSVVLEDMKPLSFSFAVVGFAGVLTLGGFGPARADDTAPAATTSGSATNSSDSGDLSSAQQERREKMKEAFQQLDLTDAQKQQMAQIRQNVTDPKERRQQIIAVLTPDQKAKLVELIKAQRDASQADSGLTNAQ